jgi:carboxymethylenebutenolidase
MPPVYPMLDFIKDIEGVREPMCIIWGDRDHAAPAEVQDAYRAAASRVKNLDLHIFPGVLHGYMMRDAGEAFDKPSRDFSMTRAKAILAGLRGARSALRQAS